MSDGSSNFVALVLRHTAQPCTARTFAKTLQEVSGWDMIRTQLEIQRALDRDAIEMLRGWRLVNKGDEDE